MNNKRHPRIIQIASAKSTGDGASLLISLDDLGRIWVADLDELDHRPAWQEVYPIPADESTEKPAKTAPADPAERAGLYRELDSILYHASRDLHFMAQEIEDAIERLGGGSETDVAAVAVDLIRLASRICAQAGPLEEVQK